MHNYLCYSYYDTSRLVLNVGTDSDPGPMYDFPSMLLTEDYPSSLYMFTLEPLGRRKKDYVLSQPRHEEDHFRFKIKFQTSPNDSYNLASAAHDFYIANQHLMNPDNIASFNWPYLTSVEK